MNLKTTCFKKLISFFLCIAFVFGNSLVSFAQNAEVTLGDIDGNNIVNAEDAAMVLAAVLKGNSGKLTDEQLRRARVTGNEVITVNDAALILQKVLDNNIKFIPFVESTDTTTSSSTISSESTTVATTEASTISTEDTTVTSTEALTTSTEDSTVATTEALTTSTEVTTVITTEDLTENTTENQNKPALIASLKGDDLTTQIFTADTVVGEDDFFTIKATSTKTVTVSRGNINYNEENYTNKIALGGTGVSGENGNRSIAFKVKGSATIKVIATGRDNNGRYLALSDGENEIKAENECMSDADTFTLKYSSDSETEKTLYLYSTSSGINIYKIDVYSGILSEGDNEPSTEPSTESPIEDSTVQPPIKDSDNSFDIGENEEAKEYTENTSVGEIGVIADATNKISVVDANETVGEAVYKKALEISSNGDKNSGALAINIDKPSKISVIAKGTAGTEKIVISNDSNTNIEAQTVSNTTGEVNFTYVLPAGNVYLHASDLVDTNKVTIYSIKVYNINSNDKFNHTGFGAENVTGGGVISETDTAYKKVSNAKEFDEAIKAAKNGKVKVIEITNDLNLGIYEIAKDNPDYNFTTNNIIQEHTYQALNNDILKESGISSVYIQDIKNGLTIFSKNGSTVKHSCWIIKRCENIIIRNLKFDELWEWDEGDIELDADPGNYDRNDWDYMTFEDTHNAWVDHCTFNKAYDGLVDIKNAKASSYNIAISWCNFLGDDRSENSWVTKQINQLEDFYTKNEAEAQTKYPLYYNLRKKGYTKEQIIAVEAPQKKAHLVGHTNTKDANMSQLSVTIYNCYYKEIQDRIPRLRGGNAHIFNSVIDSEALYSTNNAVNPKPPENMTTAHFGITSQALLSTCGGALLAENLYMKDVTKPMSFEQDAGYAGKLLAKNIKYELHKKGSDSDYNVQLPSVNSTDGNSNFKPEGKGSTIEDFTWNESSSHGYVSNQKLMYDYDLIDTTDLYTEVVPNTGAGNQSTADWTIEQWLSVKYE